MKNRTWFMAAAVMLPVVLGLLAGCKTTVPVTYTEPARLDLSGVNRVAVDSNNSQVTAGISQKLTATGKYTIASEAELAEWKQWYTDRQAREELARRYAQAAAVSSADLVRAYVGNAVRADSSYLGKGVQITAAVSEIGKSSRGRYFVRLEGSGNDSVTVFFVPFEVSALAAVDRGQTITIVGECRGYNQPDMEDTAEILRILGAGRSINIIDAVFPGLNDYSGPVGAVVSLNTTSSTQDEARTVQRAAGTGADGKTIYRNATVYDRTATVNINYQVLRGRNGSLIGEGTKSGSSSVSGDDRSQLSAPDVLVTRAISKPMDEFAAEIVPTQRSISITLAKSDNKDAQKEMAAAEKLVKAGSYADAAAAYGEIYARYENFAAGYNQAVLTEVAANAEAAIALMEVLSRETGDPLAQSALDGMRSRNAANQRAAAQLSQ